MTLASGELRNHGRGVSGAEPLTLKLFRRPKATIERKIHEDA